MLKIHYKINEENIKLLSKMNASEIKGLDFFEGNLVFQTSEKVYDVPELNPDALLSWINFLPIDKSELEDGYKEDIWGTGFWMVYKKEGIFTFLKDDKSIFNVPIKPKELIDSFKKLYLDLRKQLIQINPNFKDNEIIKDIDNSYEK